MAAPNPLASGAEKSRIRYAQEARRALISELDKATGGQYKAALREYGDLLGAERALNRGRELLNMDPQAAAALYRKAGAAEREGLRVGLAQELQRRIRKASVDGSSRNIASNLVGSEQNKQIFRAVLGKDADKFIEELSGVNRAVKNYGIVEGGSDTKENFMLGKQLLNFASQPVTKTLNMVGNGLDWLLGINQEQIARMLRDPGYAAVMRAKAGALPPSAYVDISGAGGAFANIWGPLTKKEKDVLRPSIKKELTSSLRNKKVHNELKKEDLRFNNVGLGKAINSSASLEKIKILPHLAEISAKGKPLPENWQPKTSKQHEYLWTPVKDGNKYDVAVTALEKDSKGHPFFHNTNMWDYFMKKATFRTYPAQSRNRGKLLFGTSAAGDPSTKRGMPKATNSIAEKTGKIKGKKNNYRSMKDLLILLQRPWTLGLQGNIARENTEDK